MKTNSTLWNGQHAVVPASSNENYQAESVSFIDFLLESQRNNFYPEKTHSLIASKDGAVVVTGHVQWFKGDYGLFHLLWRDTPTSTDWVPLDIDSFTLTAQVQIA